MPIDPGGDGGGGGGTGAGSSICWISPTDLMGQIDSLMQRVANLETTISLLASGDVNAALLTDLANALGLPVDFMLTVGSGDPGDPGYTGIVFSDLGISLNGGISYIPNSAGMALIYANSQALMLQASTLNALGAHPMAVKSVYGSAATNPSVFYVNQASLSSRHYHPNGSYSSAVNIGNTYLTEVAAAGEAGKKVWMPSLTGDYFINLYLVIEPGTSVPTSGWVDVTLERSQVEMNVNVYFAGQTITIPTTNWNASDELRFSISKFDKITTSPLQGFSFNVANYTNGDIKVSYMEASFQRL